MTNTLSRSAEQDTQFALNQQKIYTRQRGEKFKGKERERVRD